MEGEEPGQRAYSYSRTYSKNRAVRDSHRTGSRPNRDCPPCAYTRRMTRRPCLGQVTSRDELRHSTQDAINQPLTGNDTEEWGVRTK